MKANRQHGAVTRWAVLALTVAALAGVGGFLLGKRQAHAPENAAAMPLDPGAGAVLSITLDGTPQVNYFVGHGSNVVAEDKAAGITGFKSPDNLANGPDGRLWIVEDNVPSDIWVAEPDHDGDGKSDGVHLFASLKDDGAEGTGIYFGKDPQTLFVNVQHSGTGNDKTMVITKRNSKK